MIQIDSSICDDDLEDYLFADSDKVTILTDYPDTTTHEANIFESIKPGLFSKMKDMITGWMSSNPSEGDSPEIKFIQGTYSCKDGSCSRVPEDKSINYAKIKEVSITIFLSPVITFKLNY